MGQISPFSGPLVTRTQLEKDYGEFVPSRALPTEPVDLAFLQRRYGGITHQTFLNRREAIPGKKWGRKVGKRLLYSTEEVSILDAIDYFILAGATLKEVTAHWIEKNGEDLISEEAEDIYSQKALNIEAANTTTDIVVQGVKQGDLETATERLGELIASKVEQAVERAMKAANDDPLRTARLLREAADNGFLVTSKQLASILGFSPKTVQSWDDGEIRFGFGFDRVKRGFWRVRELTDEEALWRRAAENAAIRQKEAEKAAAEEARRAS